MDFVSIPFRDFWVLAPQPTYEGLKLASSFNPFQGFLGSGTTTSQSLLLRNSCFNPFQGFLGSGTKRLKRLKSSVVLFQSLSGIFGFWHKEVFTMSQAPSLFQSLSGIFGFWHIFGGYRKDLPLFCFNPFQGFLGSGTFAHRGVPHLAV